MKTLAWFLIILNYATVLHSQELKPIKLLDEYINIKMERDKIPGLSVCLIKDGGIVDQRIFRWQKKC